MHGVDVNLVEERSRNGDDRGNVDFSGLLELTLVTGVDVPFDVMIERGPPEAIGQGAPCGVHTLMAEVVVYSVDDGKTLGRGDKELVLPISVASPKLAV